MKVAVAFCCFALFVANIQAQIGPQINGRGGYPNGLQDPLLRYMLSKGQFPGAGLGGPMGPGAMGPGPMGPSPMGLGPMGPGPMGLGPMGPGPMGPGPMGPAPVAPLPAVAGPFGGPPSTYDFRTMAIYNILSNYINGAAQPVPKAIPPPQTKTPPAKPAGTRR